MDFEVQSPMANPGMTLVLEQKHEVITVPSSVRETERVVRSRSRIPTCASSRATARLMPGWETFKDFAAAAKPPDLTTAARALTPFRRRSSKLIHLC